VKDAVGNVQRVVVLGGTSDIALATVRRLAGRRRDVQVTLAARPGERRAAAGASLLSAGLQVSEVDFDATDRTSYERAIASCFETGADVDVVMVAFGLLGDQERAWQDLDAALQLVEVNYTAAVACGVLVAARLRAQGHGTIIAMSSVAGERARKSNFVYGSTKAGLDAFYSGLGDAMAADGVQVLVVRPGFVRTKMTEGLDAVPLSQTPEQVADVIVAGLLAGRHTVWAPAKMRWVMSVLRHLPRSVFRRLPV
jgi:decaprenylphospho-beta-D-erythro-pentofuranosid-2-ulose 2-reductase